MFHVKRRYVATGRNGYTAVDELGPTGPAVTRGPLFTGTRKDAELVAYELAVAYEAGWLDRAAQAERDLPALTAQAYRDGWRDGRQAEATTPWTDRGLPPCPVTDCYRPERHDHAPAQTDPGALGHRPSDH